MGYNSKTIHFWPYVGIAKLRLRGGSYFWFLKFLFTFFTFCLQFVNTTIASQTHFGLANMGSKVLFRVINLRKRQFWFWSLYFCAECYFYKLSIILRKRPKHPIFRKMTWHEDVVVLLILTLWEQMGISKQETVAEFVAENYQ